MNIDDVLSLIRPADLITDLGNGVMNYKWGPPYIGPDSCDNSSDQTMWKFAITHTPESPFHKEEFAIGRHDGFAVAERLSYRATLKLLGEKSFRLSYGLEREPIETDDQRERHIQRDVDEWFRVSPHSIWASHCHFLLKRLEDTRVLLRNIIKV